MIAAAHGAAVRALRAGSALVVVAALSDASRGRLGLVGRPAPSQQAGVNVQRKEACTAGRGRIGERPQPTVNSDLE